MARVENVNTSILKQCREQLAVPIEVAKKAVESIDKIENNERRPTFKQLSKLAELYEVPRWVFVAEELPKKYQYHNNPVFRRMRDTELESPDKIHKLVTRVEQYRSLFLELREDMDNSVAEFVAPAISDNAPETAAMVRQWLSLKEPLDFDGLRQKLEEKNIFIFCTNAYTHWSKTDKSIRGLSIFYDTLPLIIINDSDYRNAQSFTLLHELGHILKKQTAIDGWQKNTADEHWCDKFAGCVLMPGGWFKNVNLDSLEAIEKFAKRIKVSTYACLVRARQLDKINQEQYDDFASVLTKKYKERQKKLKEADGGPARNRIKEVKKQFSPSFIRAVINSYYQEDINLHQSTKILDLKSSSHFLELAEGI